MKKMLLSLALLVGSAFGYAVPGPFYATGASVGIGDTAGGDLAGTYPNPTVNTSTVPKLATTNTFTLGPNIFQSGGANNVPLIAKGAAAQGAALFQVKDNNDNVTSAWDSTGAQLTLGRASNLNGKLVLANSGNGNILSVGTNTQTVGSTSANFPNSAGVTTTVAELELAQTFTAGQFISAVTALTVSNVAGTGPGVITVPLPVGPAAGNSITIAASNAVTTGNGGDVVLTAKDAVSAGNANGGNVTLNFGAKTGTGNSGGLRVPSAVGANAGASISGTSAAMGAGTTVVNTTAVTANSIVLLTCNTLGGTQGILRVSAISAGVSFTITSSNGADTSTVNWWIVN